MGNFKRLDPKDIDETLIKLIEFSGARYVLLPFIDATGAAPEFRSLGHATLRDSVTVEDLTAMSKSMQSHATSGSNWFILFNTPWLLTQTGAEAIRTPRTAR